MTTSGTSNDAFASAALAVVDGHAEELRSLIANDPSLVRARSGDEFDATLLHFVAANGVPDTMQRSPENTVEIAGILLDAGADPDATSNAYSGGPNSTPLCLLVSSWHPFERGVQSKLVEVFVERGASVDGLEGDGAPLTTALVFGYSAAAEALDRAGARTDSIFFAAGLGDLDGVKSYFVEPGELREGSMGTYRPVVGRKTEPRGAGDVIQEAFHFAITHERIEVASWLLDQGALVDGETTGHHCELPLLQALFVHDTESARWLLEKGADPDLVDGKRAESARDVIERRELAELARYLK